MSNLLVKHKCCFSPARFWARIMLNPTFEPASLAGINYQDWENTCSRQSRMVRIECCEYSVRSLMILNSLLHRADYTTPVGELAA
jgi:hypothetical protein